MMGINLSYKAPFEDWSVLGYAMKYACVVSYAHMLIYNIIIIYTYIHTYIIYNYIIYILYYI